MEIKPYKREYSEVVKLLYEKGVLARLPKQEKRDDLQYAEGIDITIPLVGMTPAKFKEYAEPLLWLAYEEVKRYKEASIKFAKFEVQLNRTEKGRKMLSKPKREYTARGHSDSDVMIFGKKALGYTPTHFIEGKEVEMKTSLTDKVDEILAIAETYMKEYVQRQRPYKVIALVVSIREKRPIEMGS